MTDATSSTTSASEPWAARRRILVLVPHPDDEVVGCGAAILRAHAAGAAVHGFFLTTGIPTRELLWPWQRPQYQQRLERRRQESRAVAERLALTPLEYCAAPARTLRSELLPVWRRLQEVIAQAPIDTLWAPAYEGGHQDHDCANALAAALNPRGARTGLAVWEFAEYNFCGGAVRTNSFPAPHGGEIEIVLTAEEQRLKHELLAAYASARGDLGYVGTSREVLRPLARYDYSRPAHEGPLFYQRFHWVPFRHPRVDFTRPAEVCRGLTDFLGAAREHGR